MCRGVKAECSGPSIERCQWLKGSEKNNQLQKVDRKMCSRLGRSEESPILKETDCKKNVKFNYEIEQGENKK